MDASRSAYESLQIDERELDECEAQKQGNTDENKTMQAEDAGDET
jgi:hypothetical protein